MDSIDSETTGPTPAASARRLSYKFQRLRERIRAAVAAGELVGKLPGERSLARQFNVNAKTLSKALTDLAAEGVLQRNIGLGTFVRDPSAAQTAPKILLLTAPGQGEALAAAMNVRGLDVHALVPDGDLPPSAHAPFELVLVASPLVSDDVVRALIVRGKSVVTIDRLAQPYSTHALLPHTTLAATRAAMDLVTLGHKRLLLIPDGLEDGASHRAITDALPDAEVRPTEVADTARAAAEGFTGVVCAIGAAARVIETCRVAGLAVPQAVSVTAYGRLSGEPECTGHYITDRMIADVVTDLLVSGLPHKPLTLWLTGECTDLGTTAPPASVT